MATKTRVLGGDRLGVKLRKIAEDLRAELKEAVVAGAGEVRDSAVGSMREPKTGRLVTRGAALHRASAAGEPPAVETGRLQASVHTEVDLDGLGAEVGTALDYGAFLEFGTRKIAARPWLFPAFERRKKGIRARIKRALGDALGAAGGSG